MTSGGFTAAYKVLYLVQVEYRDEFELPERYIGPGRASMFFNLIPLFTALIAAAVIGESLAAYHAVGGVLTVAGVLLAELWKAPLRRPVLAGS